MGLLGSALTDYVAVGNAPWGALVDFAVTLSNGEGETKIRGEATAELPESILPGCIWPRW